MRVSYHSGLDYCLICRCKSDVSTIETILYEYSLRFVEAPSPFKVPDSIKFQWDQKLNKIKHRIILFEINNFNTLYVYFPTFVNHLFPIFDDQKLLEELARPLRMIIEDKVEVKHLFINEWFNVNSTHT